MFADLKDFSPKTRTCSYCKGTETRSSSTDLWTCDTHCNGCGMDIAHCSCEPYPDMAEDSHGEWDNFESGF